MDLEGGGTLEENPPSHEAIDSGRPKASGKDPSNAPGQRWEVESDHTVEGGLGGSADIWSAPERFAESATDW